MIYFYSKFKYSFIELFFMVNFILSRRGGESGRALRGRNGGFEVQKTISSDRMIAPNPIIQIVVVKITLHTLKHIDLCTHKLTHAYTCTYTNRHVHTNSQVHKLTHTHTHTHKHMHIYKHRYIYRWVSSWCN